MAVKVEYKEQPGYLLHTLKLVERGWHIKPFTFRLKPGLNVVVGDNGSGKSSLIRLLVDNSTLCKFKRKMAPGHAKLEYKYVDTEKHNPRMKGSVQFATRGETGSILNSHFLSHGQVMNDTWLALTKFKDLLIIIDEPEAGLSLKSLMALQASFKAALANGCQIVLATHSPWLMRLSDQVFDMEKRKWVSTEKYLKPFRDSLRMRIND